MTYVNVVRNGRILEIEMFWDHAKALDAVGLFERCRRAAVISGSEDEQGLPGSPPSRLKIARIDNAVLLIVQPGSR